MFKRLFLGLVFILLVSSVYAEIELVSPISKIISNNEMVFLGEIESGQTFEIIIDKSGKNINWTSINLENSLPTGWKMTKRIEQQNIVLSFSIPVSFPEKKQELNFVLNSNEISEKFIAEVYVKEKALLASVLNLRQEAILGGINEFKLIVSNPTIAPYSLDVKSTLPNYWMESFTLNLKSKEKKEIIVKIMPLSYGLKQFDFQIYPTHKKALTQSISAELIIKPSLKGKFVTPLTGFPIFTPNMLSFYLINSLLSLLG